jgi:hypothetical protein
MRQPSDDKVPFVAAPGPVRDCAMGWDKIAEELQRAISKNRTEKPILVVECYPGVDESAVLSELKSRLTPTLTIRAADAYQSPEKIDKLVTPYLHYDDPPQRFDPNPSRKLSLVNFFDAEPLWRFRRTIDALKSGLVLIVGCGASLVAWGDKLIFADLARREARLRFQRNETGNLGTDNQSASATLKNQRAFHVDWAVADRWKRPLIKRWDYVLDTHAPAEPKLADAGDVRRGLQAAAKRPFRVVPSPEIVQREFHESARSPSPKVKIPNQHLDCMLEENSLLLDFAELRIEVPAVDLLFYPPNALLGEAAHARSGHDLLRFGSLATTGSLSEPIAHCDGWREERLRVDERAPIELRRHWFSKTVAHDTRGSVNILKLVEGTEAIIESSKRAFEPFVVHFAETFIVPAAVGGYNIRPHGPSAGTEIATIKASVKIRDFNHRIP